MSIYIYGLGNLKAGEGNIYGMNDYLNGRRNAAAYSDFYSTVVRGVLGKMEFKHRVRTYPLGMEIGTISDEALGLLIVENYIDRWIDIYRKSNGEIRNLPSGDSMPKKWLSQVSTKYTASAKDGIRSKGGTAIADDPDDCFNRKWSAAGIVRFNELRQFVKQDREEHPCFLTTWMSAEKTTLKATKRSDNLFVEREQVVEADNDLDSCNDEKIRAGEMLVKPKSSLGCYSDDDSTVNEETAV